MPNLSLGEVVRKARGADDSRVGGIIKHMTCHGATKKGGNICDRNTCPHHPKTDIWVKWPNGDLYSYNPNELVIDEEGETEVLDTLQDLIANGNSDQIREASLGLKALINARKNRVIAADPEVVVAVEESRPSSILGMVKSDATNAAYRVAAKQINTGMQNALVDLVKKKGANNSQIEGFAVFLQTDIGAAILGTLAGYGLTYAPMLSKDPRAQRLAKEFRVGGLATAGNAVVGALVDEVMPIINNLGSLPGEEMAALGAASEEVSAIGSTKSGTTQSETENREDDSVVVSFEEVAPDQEILEAMEEESQRSANNGN